MTQYDMNIIIEDYLNSKEGQIILSTLIDTNYMQQASEDLKAIIIDTFLKSLRSYNYTRGRKPTFPSSKVIVKSPQYSHKDKRWGCEVLFKPEALRRESLLNKDGSRTGKGVDDIFALITNGYSTTKKVNGIWTAHDYRKVIPSLEERKGTNFMKNAVKEFKTRYPDTLVRYPKSWGGRLSGL